MEFNKDFEDISVIKKREKFCEQIKIDCKTEIESETVAKILCLEARSFAEQTEKDKGTFSYGGKTVFYLCYKTVDGEIKKCECGSEFKGDTTVKTEMRDVSVTAFTDKQEWDLSGSRVLLNATVTLTAVFSGMEKIKVLSGGDGLTVNGKEVVGYSPISVRRGIFPVEEDFNFNYTVKEVICHSADFIEKTAECGVGVVTIEGDFIYRAVIRKSDGDIVREEKVIPSRYEVEILDVMPSDFAEFKCVVKTFKTDISVDEEKSESEVMLSSNVCYEVKAYSKKDCSLIEDAFCLFRKVNIERGEYPLLKEIKRDSVSFTASGRVNVLEDNDDASLYAVGGEKAEVLSVSTENGKSKVTGYLSVKLFFGDLEGNVFVERAEIPFESEIDAISPDVAVKVKSVSAKKISAGEVEITAQMVMVVTDEINETVSFVKDVIDDGEKETNDFAISVYIPIEGEDLWSLSKRLNVLPEQLVQSNKDLQFPLTGKERIVVFRQK